MENDGLKTIRFDLHRQVVERCLARTGELDRLLIEAQDRQMKLMERAHRAEIQVEELLIALHGTEPVANPGMLADTASFKLRQLLRAEEHVDAIRAAIRIAKDQLLVSEQMRQELEGKDTRPTAADAVGKSVEY